MADYEKRYRLNAAPAGRLDGSGCVDHDTEAVYRLQGSVDPFAAVPGRHKTVSVPAAALKGMNDMPDATGPQRTAKTAAYKDALAGNLNTFPVAAEGWTLAALEALLDANDAAALEAGRAHTYITVTLGQSYPVTFSL